MLKFSIRGRCYCENMDVSHMVILILLLTYLESVWFNQTWLQAVCHKNFKSTIASTLMKSFHSTHPSKSVNPLRQLPNLEVVGEDVQTEEQLAHDVDESQGVTHSLLTRNLWKSYGGSKIFHRRTPGNQVVRNFSILIPKGEIHGLLGPNGAGKSTMLSMVVGEVTPDRGDVFVNGCHIKSDCKEAIESMGSCPQTDTLWDDIKVSEHLELFAALNDLSHEQATNTLAYFISGLAVKEHLFKKVSNLSGGTRRKLTFMISMMGSPPLVLLDEPSTGLDPQSKRFLWDVITQNFGGDRSAVLTTHSMEEADALCDRISIMVNGRMRCIGTSQHLKNIYGSGYVLELRLKFSPTTKPDQDLVPVTPASAQYSAIRGADTSPDIPAIATATETVQQKTKAEVLKLFPQAHCTDQRYNRMVFTIGKDQFSSLSAAFTDLEKMKQSLDLEEYSFSQTTLEQVFAHFAAMQEGLAKRTNGA